ncbi:D-alanyl-D-alanine carboxypeptidase/D-alanyl-D-alanine endopeptidase [Nocardioides aurantiacus]|uniref:D-alanyl-D-alanine carboxypeptidase/D-alanyl-D-alanine endopeptidase n=1 Tax=Nocardioides aurantiacus TaxID=86796 RepID=UPI00403F4FB2
MGRERRHSHPVLRHLAELTVLVLLAAAVVSYRYDLGERWFGWGPVDPATEPAAVLPPEGLRLPASRVAPRVAVTGEHVDVDPAKVSAAVAPLLKRRVLGPHFAVLVTDLATGEEVFRAGARSVVPASTTKLLTSVAALESLGGTSRFTTSTRWQPQAGRLVLVGGGDPFLASTPSKDDDTYPRRADLQTLAERSAEALRAEGVRRVRLGYDDSLFSGPGVNPTWEPGYLDDITSPISALWADQAQDPDGFGFVADPAADAARVFAGALRRAGVQVRGPVARTPAPAGATTTDPPPTLASVRSATVGEVVERTLAVSDNQAADVLAHHVGLAESGQGSFEGGAAGVLAVVERLGVPVAGARLLDGSGLSRDNRLSPDTLAGVLRLVVEQDRPELRQVLTGLPVAGFTGSLALRFDEGPQAARGRVRAKTGTLTGVHGLAGVADDPSGGRTAFVVVTDRAPADGELDARVRVDRIAAALGACRCGVGSAS